MVQGEEDSSGSGSDSASSRESDSDASDHKSAGHASQQEEDNAHLAAESAGMNADPNQGKDSAQKQRKHKHSKKRQKQDDSAKKRKKQKQLKKKTAVTDWTSDDSSDGGPAAIPDHLNPMPDSDAEEEAAMAASPAADAEIEQSVDAPSSSDGKAEKPHKKRRLHQAGSKQKPRSRLESKAKAAADWSSDGDSAAPGPIPGNLNSMPHSGSDGEGSAGTGKQARCDAERDQQQAKRAKHAAEPGSSPAKDDVVSPAVAKKLSSKKQQKRASAKAHDAGGTGQKQHDTPKADPGTEHCILILWCSADAYNHTSLVTN